MRYALGGFVIGLLVAPGVLGTPTVGAVSVAHADLPQPVSEPG
ncbi:hypothetical protein ACMGDM_15210 [Sphingomonas sp. DT-51]